MPSSQTETEIDRLYQLPLGQFTSARNSLAKAIEGSDRRRIKSLQKPTLAAWAVNQWYWRSRRSYDTLVKTAERLRAAHRRVLSGAAADLRGADTAHREALKDALDRAVRIMEDSGQVVGAGTRQAIATTLEALPAQAEPGRLTETLEPTGFEALAGLPATRDGGRRPRLRLAGKPAPAPEATAKARASARKALSEARRAVGDARRAQTRAESAVTEARRRLDRARSGEQEARQAWKAAQARVETLEQELERLRFESAAARQTTTRAEEDLSAHRRPRRAP